MRKYPLTCAVAVFSSTAAVYAEQSFCAGRSRGMGPPQAAHTRQKLFEPITICPLVALCDHDERYASPASVHETIHEQTPDITYNRRWGGWDSNPRLAMSTQTGPIVTTVFGPG